MLEEYIDLAYCARILNILRKQTQFFNMLLFYLWHVNRIKSEFSG